MQNCVLIRGMIDTPLKDIGYIIRANQRQHDAHRPSRKIYSMNIEQQSLFATSLVPWGCAVNLDS